MDKMTGMNVPEGIFSRVFGFVPIVSYCLGHNRTYVGSNIDIGVRY